MFVCVPSERAPTGQPVRHGNHKTKRHASMGGSGCGKWARGTRTGELRNEGLVEATGKEAQLFLKGVEVLVAVSGEQKGKKDKNKKPRAKSGRFLRARDARAKTFKRIFESPKNDHDRSVYALAVAERWCLKCRHTRR